MRAALLFILMLVCVYHMQAQDSTSAEFQDWTDLTTIYHISEKWVYSGDYGIRGLSSSDEWTTFYIRPTIRYLTSLRSDVRAGVAWFHTSEELLETTNEVRLHQQGNLKWPNLNDWILKHMVRFEERFFFYKNLENSFSARARYRIGLETPDLRILGMKNNLYAVTSLELFVPLGDQSVERFVNSNRIVAGLGYRTKGQLKFELHYIWQNSGNYDKDGLQTTENVLRLRIFLNTNDPK